jgi:tetratricopeptide (TPR) repeat protein
LKNFGLHSKINLESREFHIHTGSVNEKNMVVCEIFESGKFITTRSQEFLRRSDDREMRELNFVRSFAQRLHNDLIDEIELLFKVDKKIRLLHQHVPHFKLGSVFYNMNFIDEAIDNFSRAIDIDPNYIPAYIRLGKCFYAKNDHESAVETLEKAYVLKPEFPDVSNSLGVGYTLLQDYERAAELLQQAIRKNPDYEEANFNLGIVLFRSTLVDSEDEEKLVVPSRVIRYIRALKTLERYSEKEWVEVFDETLEILKEGEKEKVLDALEKLQIRLATYLKINTTIETFFLKFMYGGRELSPKELEEYELRIQHDVAERENFADFWNEMGMVHMIQCRNLFLRSLEEFEKAVNLNDKYGEAKRNLELIKNNKKGFLILLRAILK